MSLDVGDIDIDAPSDCAGEASELVLERDLTLVTFPSSDGCVTSLC